MRYALRNQEKIKEYFEPNGEKMLRRINESLKEYFSESDQGDVENNCNHISGESYTTLSIPDVGNENREIQFYVIGRQYDVLKLAFKGFIKY